MKMINKKIIMISLLASTALLGATPNIGNIEKEVIPPKDVTKQKDKTLVDIGGVKEYAPAMKDIKDGKSIFVKKFKINGAIHIKEDTLQELISTYKNQELTFSQLEEITSIITKYYRQKGYFVTRAYLPIQDIYKNDGTILINIIEGNYGKFKLNNNSLVKDSIVHGMLDDAKRDNIVSTSTLERSMLIINDTPGVQVTKANVKPGEKVGTSDFEMDTQATKKFEGYAVIDNAGSKYTGKNRLMLGVDVNSPFKIGDKISAFGLISNGANLKNGSLSYSFPLMSNGLRGDVSYTQTNYSLTKNYSNLDALGYSKAFEMGLTYPIKRTRLENLYASLTLSSKDLKDEIRSINDTTKKDIKSARFGLSYDKDYLSFGKNSQSQIDFGLTYGRLSFDDATKKANDLAGANTNGNYSKINLDLSHEIVMTQKISLETSLQMQYALKNKNLDGSEDLSIGGYSGVKLYPSGELNAENGYVFNIEAKYNLPNFKSLTNTVGIFYDRGRAFMANNTTGFEAKSLQDVGIGYYTTYKDFFGKVQVAWNANSKKVTSEPNRNSRILFQLGLTF